MEHEGNIVYLYIWQKNVSTYNYIILFFIYSIILMKPSSPKSFIFLKYSAIFLLGSSAIYFVSAYTSINTALTNATQYIQNTVLTDDGTQSGNTGIILNGVNGNIISRGFVSRWTWVSANGVNATAMGNSTQAIKNYSTAMGYQTYANGDSSTAMGNNTQTNAESATSMWNSTQADGVASTAMGRFSEALGYVSTAIGINARSFWTWSMAIGDNTEAHT